MAHRKDVDAIGQDAIDDPVGPSKISRISSRPYLGTTRPIRGCSSRAWTRAVSSSIKALAPGWSPAM